jgi:hypothetical protein
VNQVVPRETECSVWNSRRKFSTINVCSYHEGALTALDHTSVKLQDGHSVLPEAYVASEMPPPSDH